MEVDKIIDNNVLSHITNLEGGGKLKTMLSDIKKSLINAKRSFFKIDLKSFMYDYYDTVDNNVDSFYHYDKNIKDLYSAKKLRNECKSNTSGKKRLSYINGQILKFLLKAELLEYQNEEELYNDYLANKKQAEKNKTPLPEEVMPYKKTDWIFLCKDKCYIDKTYINDIINNIIDSLNQLSLTIDFESRVQSQEKSKKLTLLVTLVVISMTIASQGFGGVFIVLSAITNIADKIIKGPNEAQILNNDTKFIRDKYTFDRFNLFTTNSLAKKSYLKLQEVDKSILNMAQKYNLFNEQGKKELIANVFKNIKDLQIYIDDVLKKGIPKFATPTKKNKTKSYISTLTQVKTFYNEYEQYDNDNDKIINILNDFSKYILSKNARVTIEEDLANAILKYNSINESTTKLLDYTNEDDAEYIDGLQTTVLLLLHEYLSLLDNTDGKSIDLPQELLSDKIDTLSNLDKDKLIVIFKKILKILNINSKNDIKNTLNNFSKEYNKNNIGYICNKIKIKYDIRQKATYSQFEFLINDIKDIFIQFKENINKIDDNEELENICVELNFNKKDPVNKNIKISKIKKIKEFLTKMNNIFVTSEINNSLTSKERKEEQEEEEEEESK